MSALTKTRLKKQPWYPILQQTYQLSESECDFLARLARNADAELVTWDNVPLNGIEGLTHLENLKLKFNTKDEERLAQFGRWLVTGECPVFVTDRERLKICIPEPHGCGLAYGIDMFPFWPLDDRCVLCIKKCVAKEPTYRKQLDNGRALQSILNIAKRPDVMSPHISHVLGQIYALDGGPAGFARHVHDHIVALREKDAACYALGKMYMGLMNLTAIATKLDQETVNLDDIDDEGLKKYLKDLLITKMSKEEAVRCITEANAEVDQLVLDAKRAQEEADAETELTNA